MAHDGDRCGAFARVVVLQQAPEGRLNAQGPQRVRRHAGPLQAHRLVAAEERRLVSAEPGERLERPLTRPQVHEVAQRDVGLREARLHVTVAEHHEVVGAFERQRPQQRGLDDGKERSVRADAQGEGDDGGGREGRLAVEDPKRLAKFAHLHGCVRRWSRDGCCEVGRAGSYRVETDVNLVPARERPGDDSSNPDTGVYSLRRATSGSMRVARAAGM